MIYSPWGLPVDLAMMLIYMVYFVEIVYPVIFLYTVFLYYFQAVYLDLCRPFEHFQPFHRRTLYSYPLYFNNLLCSFHID